MLMQKYDSRLLKGGWDIHLALASRGTCCPLQAAGKMQQIPGPARPGPDPLVLQPPAEPPCGWPKAMRQTAPSYRNEGWPSFDIQPAAQVW